MAPAPRTTATPTPHNGSAFSGFWAGVLAAFFAAMLLVGVLAIGPGSSKANVPVPDDKQTSNVSTGNTGTTTSTSTGTNTKVGNAYLEDVQLCADTTNPACLG